MLFARETKIPRLYKGLHTYMREMSGGLSRFFLFKSFAALYAM